MHKLEVTVDKGTINLGNKLFQNMLIGSKSRGCFIQTIGKNIANTMPDR